VSLDPAIHIVDQLERVVVDHPEVSHHDLLALLSSLQADVEVVAMELAEGFIEAKVLHGPRAEAENEPVDRVDLSGPGIRRHMRFALPAEPGDVSATELVVAVSKRTPDLRTLPVGDAAGTDYPDAADDRYLGVGKGGADPVAEVRLDDLRVLMEEHQLLQMTILTLKENFFILILEKQTI
jgi:hypothetical protein